MSPGAGRWIEITFAVIWASFGILHLARINEISSHEGMTEFDERWDFRVGLVLGLLAGATVVAVTGVEIDMVLYTALVLLLSRRSKIAIPSSVVIMGFISLFGDRGEKSHDRFAAECLRELAGGGTRRRLGCALGGAGRD